MKASEQLNELFTALAKVQADLPAVVKDNRVNAGNIRYTYADLASVLETVLPRLAAQGLSLAQHPGLNEHGELILRTTLGHTSGQWMSSDYPIKPVRQDPQSTGSAITYARRYAIMAVCGVGLEDDDGAAASQGGAPGPAANDSGHREVRKPYRAGGVPRGTRAQGRPVAESQGHMAPSQVYEETIATIRQATTSADLDTAIDLAREIEDPAERENARLAYSQKIAALGFGAKPASSESTRQRLTRKVLQGDETA